MEFCVEKNMHSVFFFELNPYIISGFVAKDIYYSFVLVLILELRHDFKTCWEWRSF